MTQSIMTFYSENVLFKQQSQPVKRLLHWVLQAIGSSMAITGMIIEYVNRRSHFQTKHSVIGLIAGIFTLIAMANGVSALWSVEMRKYVAPVYLKFFHVVVGLTAFVLGEWQQRWIINKITFLKNHKIDYDVGFRHGGVVLRLRQKVYDQKFTGGRSNVAADTGHYNYSSFINWRIENTQQLYQNHSEIIADAVSSFSAA